MSQLPPAGWHPDPLGRQAQRYWDGQQWTEHVADQSGNMSTDPLEGPAQPTQQAETQADQGSAAAWSGTQETSSDWDQGQQDAGWGALPAEPDQDTSGAFDSTWGDTATTGEAAAAGGAAAAGAAAAGVTSEPGDATGWGATSAETESPTASAEASTEAATGTDEAADDGEDDADWTGGVVAMEIDDDAIVASAGAVVARQSSVTPSEHDDGEALTGPGTVWLGAGGHEVTVITLQAPGLTVNRAALVAHSGGLDRQDAHPGIVGFAGVRLSGAGWVALSAHGGLAEVPTTGGVEVASTALVAFTNDLDVSHADTVHLSGTGMALVSGG